MKRLTLILVAGLAALVTGCAQPAYVSKSDAEDAYLRGDIAQIREIRYDNPVNTNRSADNLDKYDILTVIDYNRAGNITREESFKGQELTLISREEYVYDVSGKRLERAVTHDLARRGTITVLYKYDDKGRLVSEVESNGSYRFDQIPDRRGYPKIRTTDDVDTQETVVIARYFYDRVGRLKKLKGERNERYRYHPNGAIAEIRTGRRGRSSLDLYDDRGNLTAMAVRVGRRNQKGRIYERFSVTLTAEYEFDSHGNWIRRTRLYKGEVQNVTVREIDYYEDR